MVSRRILMLANRFPPETFGGAEQQCLRLSQALVRLGHRPHILTSYGNPETPVHEMLGDVPISRLYTPDPPQNGGPAIGSTIRYARAVPRWLDSQPPFDIIHCHQAKINAWIGVREAVRRGLTSVVKPGAAGPNFDFFSLEKKKFFYGKYAARYVAKHADAVVAISQEMRQDLIDYGLSEKQRHFIPNGVPIPDWDAAGKAAIRARIRAEVGLSDSDQMVLFVGRMVTQKNVDTLLKAFARVPGQAHLVLLGDGALLDDNRALAAELGIGERAHFRGRVDNVTEYLAASDLFVLPAIAEGMSNALLEAMAAGAAPLASRVSGNTDLVRDGENGWLYGPPRDPEALAAGLATALALPPEALARVAATARQEMIDTFSIDAIAARYDALYDQICPPSSLSPKEAAA